MTEAELAAALASSRAAWPGVDVAPDVFRMRLTDDTTCVADVYLACAIERGDDAALRAFEVLLAAQIDTALARFDGGSALAADVRTAVRERVLAHGGKAKIAEYRGRGDLRGWLRVVAVREALQIVRARRREAPMPADLADQLVAAEAGTDHAGGRVRELAGEAVMSAEERRVYRDAFTAALATLTPRERNLLRQHYLHGATVDELGALYNVHRATPARWIAQIRETLLHRTRELVGAALSLTGTELDGAMTKLAGELDYSLRHTLSNEH